MTTQQTEINDSLQQSQGVARTQSQSQISDNETTVSSGAAAAAATAAAGVPSSWDTDIQTQLLDALSELTDLCGSPTPTPPSTTIEVTAQGHAMKTRTLVGSKPVVASKPKPTPPKPTVLPKPPKPVPVIPTDATVRPSNGLVVDQASLNSACQEGEMGEDDTPDNDSAFSDTVSLPSSGSHGSVTTTTSHHSGCSQASGSGGGSGTGSESGSSGLGTSSTSGHAAVSNLQLTMLNSPKRKMYNCP